MNTKLYLKAVIFSVGLAFTFGVADIHGKVQLKSETGKYEITQASIPMPQTEETQISLKEKIANPEQIEISAITEQEGTLHKPVQNKIKSQVETPVIVASNASYSIEKSIGRQVRPQPSMETKKAVPAGYKRDSATAEKAKPLNEKFTATGIHEASEIKARIQEAIKNRLETEKKETVQDKQNVNIVRNTEKNIFTSNDYVLTGNKYFDKGEVEKAISAYNKAIELYKNNAVAYNNRGYLFYTVEENNKALKDFDRAIKISSDYKYAFFNRANTYSTIGNYQKAISDYYMVTNLDSKFELAYVNLGNIFLKLKKRTEAEENYSKALELNKDAETYFMRGHIYLLENKYEKAINDYSRAIEIKPDFGNAYFSRGIAYESTKQLNKAIQDFNKAGELNPKINEFNSLYGRRYLNMRLYTTPDPMQAERIKNMLRGFEYQEIFHDSYLPVEEFIDLRDNANDILEVREPKFD